MGDSVMMRKFFYNKYISWALSTFAILSVILHELIEMNLCLFYFSVILICIYSSGYYLYKNIDEKFESLFLKYQLVAFIVIGILFISFFINCLQ